jgi:hypothetical protein
MAVNDEPTTRRKRGRGVGTLFRLTKCNPCAQPHCLG